MQQEEKKQIEINELMKLISEGFAFTIKYKISEKKWWQFWKKNTFKIVEEQFRIKELTLGILDRISLESVELKEEDEQSVDSNYIKTYSRKHYKRVARIISIAILGKNAEYLQKNAFGSYDLVLNEIEIKRLSTKILSVLTPSDISKLLDIIDIESNLGDFINSTRKLTAAKKKIIMTDLVEKKESAD